MRSKALLVGARAGFVGPWVNLEVGDWIVDPTHPEITLEVVHGGKESVLYNGKHASPTRHIFTGPCRARGYVSDEYRGDGVFLKVRQDA